MVDKMEPELIDLFGGQVSRSEVAKMEPKLIDLFWGKRVEVKRNSKISHPCDRNDILTTLNCRRSHVPRSQTSADDISRSQSAVGWHVSTAGHPLRSSITASGFRGNLVR